MEIYVIVPLLSLVGAGLGAYLGSYLKRKGENLATHEDIGRLVDQVTAVTQATKEIEAKISNEVWDRQRRWELKRDVLLAAARDLNAMQEALIGFHSAYAASTKSGNDNPEAKGAAVDAWGKAGAAFDAATAIVGIVCSADVKAALHDSGLLMRKVGLELFKNNLDGFLPSLPKVVASVSLSSDAIRKELNVEESTRKEGLVLNEKGPAGGPGNQI